MIVIRGPHIIGDIADHIARLEALVVDLERFTSGDLPTPDELGAAPLLSPYGLSQRPTYCLAGGNNGHPILTGQTIRASELHVIAPDQGWARTYSRLYRLGEPFDRATQDTLRRGGKP